MNAPNPPEQQCKSYEMAGLDPAKKKTRQLIFSPAS